MLEDLGDKYLISKNFNYDDAFLADIFGFSVGMDVITDDNPLSFTFNITVNKETNLVENISAVHKSESEEYKKDSVTIVTFSKYGEVPAIEIPEEAYDGELMTMEAMIAEYGLAENTDEETSNTVEESTVEEDTAE